MISDLCHPSVVVSLVNLTECVGIKDFAGSTIHDTWSWVSSAWHLGVELILVVFFQWNSNPRHFSGGVLVARLIVVTRDDDNLDILGTILVPSSVEIFQFFFERFASTSPGCGVDEHDKLVALNSFRSELISILVDELFADDVIGPVGLPWRKKWSRLYH